MVLQLGEINKKHFYIIHTYYTYYDGYTADWIAGWRFSKWSTPTSGTHALAQGIPVLLFKKYTKSAQHTETLIQLIHPYFVEQTKTQSTFS